MTQSTFAYRAADASGTIHTGVLAGEDPNSVAERVRRMGLRPVAVNRKRMSKLTEERSLPGLGGKKADALAIFSRQFSTMIGAGTPIMKCLGVLARQTKDPSFRRAIDMITADIENGDQLSEALARQPAWFTDFYVSMVRAGEQAGSLDEVLERLAVAAEAASRLRKKIRSAMAYPVAVGGLICLTVLAMLVFLIPTFKGIFKDLKGTLPLPTRVLIGVSDLILGNLPLLFVLLIVGVVWFRRWKRSESGKPRWDAIKLRTPVFGRLVRLSALARFSRSLAVLVHTGVPVVTALQVAKTTANSEVIAASVEAVAAQVANGGRISDAMERDGGFTDMVARMVEVGEETGALDQMLGKVADMYEAEVDATVDSLTSLLEPLLIVAMGLTVGAVLLAVYLPMFRVISLVK